MNSRSWTVEIPVNQWLSQNKRLHHMAHSRTAKDLREQAFHLYRAARIPKGMNQISVGIELRFPERRVRDPENFEPTIKPILDALGPGRQYTRRLNNGTVQHINEVGIGAIPDDSREHLLRRDSVIGEPLGRKPMTPAGLVVLTIQEVTP